MTIDKKFRTKFEKSMGPLTFAKFILAARTSMDLSQAEFGKKLGLSRANICDLEKGRQLVSTDMAIRIAQKAQLSEKVAIQACLQDQIRKAGLELTVQVS